jgi:simple sugar transport system permease protein
MELDQLTGLIGLVALAVVPYVLASQGTMLAGRTGQFIVYQEGLMLASASLGFLGAYEFGSLWAGIGVAALTGAAFGLAFAYFTTNLKLDQFVTGLAFFFIGLGISTLAFKLAIGVTLTPPLIPTLPKVPIPLLSQIPILGEIFFVQNLFVYFAVLLTLFLYYFLYKTSYGLELRSVGENPRAADSLGVAVTHTRYTAAIVGSILIALGGLYLPMVYTGTFTEGIVQARGWLAIALTFFGGWRPQTIFLGALFFATVEVIALRAQIFGGNIPHQLLLTLPFIATLFVMIFGAKWARLPGFLGQNYDRESRSVL